MGKKYSILFLSVFALLIFVIYQKTDAANFPPLQEGTYLTGQTLSVWPSWSVLGSALGRALPVDPINRLAPAGTCAVRTDIFCVKDSDCPALANTTTPQKCVLHDPTTGWSTVDRRFSFACSQESYAYRYLVSPGSGTYMVRARLEDTGLAPANLDDFISEFVSTTIFKVKEDSGVCNLNEEIATIDPGRCGDGKLNFQRGEDCDPPGRIEYQTGCDTSNRKHLNVCNSSCQWTASTTPCNSLSKCGNGRKEAGEACDEGGLNGRYNHCNSTCSGRSSEFCGNGIVSSTYEICDPETPGREKYGLEGKQQSCSWDCQNWGPYCGDGIVQAEHDEECDGSKTCSIDGRQGLKLCSNKCKKEGKETVVWLGFSDLEDTQVPNEKISKDRTENNNDALCSGRGCPSATQGKFGNGLEFSNENSSKKIMHVKNNQSLNIRKSLSVEAWVKPNKYDNLYQRVIEKGGAEDYKGFDLELNASSTKPLARFNVWNGVQTSVDSNSAIPIGIWTHIVATYQVSGDNYTLKIYINGVLDNTLSRQSTELAMEDSQRDIFIGGSNAGGGSNFLFGSLDEVKIYSRVLSADEVRNNFQTGWLCVVGAIAPPVDVENVSASCGNNVVDANEACDRGTTNNGRACVATYGQPCSYCAANCQNIIDVQPSEYCGNGKIEQREKCDTLSPDGIIYAAATNTAGTTMGTKNDTYNGYQELACSAEPYIPHTLQKGTKTCGDCLAGVVRNCVRCGLDPDGVGVSGGIINVLATSTGIQDPLFTRELTSSSLRLSIGACYSAVQEFNDAARNICDSPVVTTSPLIGWAKKDQNTQDAEALKSFSLLNPYTGNNALINSNPVCSQDADPTKKYLMYINRDWSRPRAFPVVAQPASWQNDLVLSPVISSTLRNKDVRVVVSWVTGEFYGGILNTFVATPDISAPLYCNPPRTSCQPTHKKYATGIRYYNTPDSQLFGVWYHGLNSTLGHTEAESFTINTANMSGNTYSFFVRSPSSPIRQFRNTARLRADVYLPDSNTSPYRFGVPIKTYFFNTSASSDNPSAKYWHVFNINKPDIANPVSSTDILDVNTIFTGPAQFKYVGDLQRDVNPIQDPNSQVGSGDPGDPFVPQPGFDPDQGNPGNPPGNPVNPLPDPGIPPPEIQ